MIAREQVHVEQPPCTNFLLITPTIGHSVLRKYAGVVIGEKIVDKQGLDNEQNALEFLPNLFKYFGAGILHTPKEKGEHIILAMDESVYASGVKNINLKLDVLLSGIIEGMLKKSTGEKWQVEETKCLANGDDVCEFTCKRI